MHRGWPPPSTTSFDYQHSLNPGTGWSGPPQVYQDHGPRDRRPVEMYRPLQTPGPGDLVLATLKPLKPAENEEDISKERHEETVLIPFLESLQKPQLKPLKPAENEEDISKERHEETVLIPFLESLQKPQRETTERGNQAITIRRSSSNNPVQDKSGLNIHRKPASSSQEQDGRSSWSKVALELPGDRDQYRYPPTLNHIQSFDSPEHSHPSYIQTSSKMSYLYEETSAQHSFHQHQSPQDRQAPLYRQSSYHLHSSQPPPTQPLKHQTPPSLPPLNQTTPSQFSPFQMLFKKPPAPQSSPYQPPPSKRPSPSPSQMSASEEKGNLTTKINRFLHILSGVEAAADETQDEIESEGLNTEPEEAVMGMTSMDEDEQYLYGGQTPAGEGEAYKRTPGSTDRQNPERDGRRSSPTSKTREDGKGFEESEGLNTEPEEDVMGMSSMDEDEQYLYGGRTPAGEGEGYKRTPGSTDRQNPERDGRRSSPTSKTREDGKSKLEHFNQIQGLLRTMGLYLDTDDVSMLAEQAHRAEREKLSSEHSEEVAELEHLDQIHAVIDRTSGPTATPHAPSYQPSDDDKMTAKTYFKRIQAVHHKEVMEESINSKIFTANMMRQLRTLTSQCSPTDTSLPPLNQTTPSQFSPFQMLFKKPSAPQSSPYQPPPSKCPSASPSQMSASEEKGNLTTKINRFLNIISDMEASLLSTAADETQDEIAVIAEETQEHTQHYCELGTGEDKYTVGRMSREAEPEDPHRGFGGEKSPGDHGHLRTSDLSQDDLLLQENAIQDGSAFSGIVGMQERHSRGSYQRRLKREDGKMAKKRPQSFEESEDFNTESEEDVMGMTSMDEYEQYLCRGQTPAGEGEGYKRTPGSTDRQNPERDGRRSSPTSKTREDGKGLEESEGLNTEPEEDVMGMTSMDRDGRRSSPISKTREDVKSKLEHFNQIQGLLRTLGLDLDTDEVSKLAEKACRAKREKLSSEHSEEVALEHLDQIHAVNDRTPGPTATPHAPSYRPSDDDKKTAKTYFKLIQAVYHKEVIEKSINSKNLTAGLIKHLRLLIGQSSPTDTSTEQLENNDRWVNDNRHNLHIVHVQYTNSIHSLTQALPTPNDLALQIAIGWARKRYKDKVTDTIISTVQRLTYTLNQTTVPPP